VNEEKRMTITVCSYECAGERMAKSVDWHLTKLERDKKRREY
jgi:hypothetical protein